MWTYLLKENFETKKFFQNFHKMIQTQFQTQIRILRTHNGNECISKNLGDYLANNGIIHQTSYINTPQQKGKLDIS